MLLAATQTEAMMVPAGTKALANSKYRDHLASPTSLRSFRNSSSFFSFSISSFRRSSAASGAPSRN
jgi:hypothetical protein